MESSLEVTSQVVKNTHTLLRYLKTLFLDKGSFMTKKILGLSLTLLLFLASWNVSAMDRRGRLGVGMTNQLAIDIPAISLKFQRSRTFAMGALMGFNSSSTNGGYGAGLKFYRIIFEEPQLNFYTSLLGAALKTQTTLVDKTGFQFDLTMGSEFSFAGIESLGFSLEFGISAHKKVNDFVVQTVGHQFINAGVHFYL